MFCCHLPGILHDLMQNLDDFRDDKELQPTFKIKMSRDGDICTLQMSGVTLKMSGEYKCVAVNSAGEAACAAKLSVVGAYSHMV